MPGFMSLREHRAVLARGAAALALGFSLTGCVLAPPAGPVHGHGQVVRVVPQPYYGAVGVAPAPGYVWTDGYWGWSGGHRVWVPGGWAAGRPGYGHTPHRWGHGHGGWRQHPGYWRRR